MKASSARAGAVGFVALSAVTASLFLACSSSDDTGGPATSADGSVLPEPLFRELQADLITSCGGANGSCHVHGTYLGAPTWLGDPDPYLSAKKYRGIIPATRDVADSVLLSQVGHEGPSLKSRGDDLFIRVSNWIQAEAPPPVLPNSELFPVIDGPNVIGLNQIPGLANAKLTFLASAVGNTLILSSITIQAPDDTNLKMTSPFFVVLPRNGKVSADPDVNGFSGELTVPAGQTVPLFAGQINLLHWDPSGQLKLVFQAVETTPGVAVTGACTALAVFQDKALAAMQMQVQVTDPDEGDGGSGGGDGGAVIGTSSCLGCHGEEGDTPKYPVAINAMDLRGTSTDPALACRNARRWINLTDKPNSTIIANPTGKANPKHPIKALPDNDPIIQNLLEWVNAEQ